VASYITGDDWTFDLSGAPEKPEPAVDPYAMPWVTDYRAWEQYQNPVVYEVDCLIRGWVEACSRNAEWARSYKKRRYTMGMVMEQAFGRKWDHKEDSKRVHVIKKVLSYYSSRIQKEAYIGGKHVRKTVYTVAPSRLKKPPYSLRLRLEWLAEKGEVPTPRNMRLPEDDLEIGHARNPRTDANMERRREQAREKYNKRYNRKERK